MTDTVSAATNRRSSDRRLRGHDYLVDLAVPNFFFDANKAYTSLRHNGVQLGKIDSIGAMPTHEANE